MSDLIDRENLIQDSEDALSWEMLGYINRAEKIDAEPVIRCKDCKYYQQTGFPEGFGWCYFNHHGFKDNDFCSGAKMDKEAE